MNLNNYSYDFIPTENSARSVHLYFANHLSYKCCNGINIEIANPRKSNIIVGVIYRYPSMDLDLTGFNSSYLNKLLDIYKEQKSIFLLGDFISYFISYFILFIFTSV